MEKKPLLSIGMIFKNEARCLERCLEALRPLREAVPCQLVMADTGSTDGSREIAARYADVLFDFPWVDDFSAARNAVMDRCFGTWFLTVDADEYLDGDISELTELLRGGDRKLLVAAVVVRSYRDREMTGEYADFLALRLLRMSTGMRYVGRVHEQWPFPEDRPVPGKALGKTIFHHDGYVDLYGEAGRPKRERNAALLRRELADRPDDLRSLMQFLESGREEPDYRDWRLRAVEAVRRKGTGWRHYGPPILREAVKTGLLEGLPQLEEWIGWAEENCPNSYFFRIDIASCAALFYDGGRRDDPEKCLRYGELYLQSLRELQEEEGGAPDLMVSSLSYRNARQERNVRLALAEACQKTGDPEKALSHLAAAFWGERSASSLGLEEMDTLALRLADDRESLFRLAQSAAVDTPQRLCWARALALATVRAFDWSSGDERGLALTRRFAQVEESFLPLCYAPGALTEEGLFLLPALHRFGWWCARAFQALDGGDPAGYVRLLRAGLEAYPGAGAMVEYLTEHTPELQALPPSPELLILAEQVRTMLAALDPEDPAVQAIKESPVYQRVARLIEGDGQ